MYAIESPSIPIARGMLSSLQHRIAYFVLLPLASLYVYPFGPRFLLFHRSQ